MKRRLSQSAAALLAVAALAQPQLARAQSCVEQQDVECHEAHQHHRLDVIYSMPLLASAVDQRCAGTLAPGGFMATQGDEFVAPYLAIREQHWPGTVRLLQSFSSKGKKSDKNGFDAAKMFETLPPDALQPFVDAIIVQMVQEQIKPESCSKIERGVELLAPLPPENVGGLLAFIVDMAGVKDPEICPYREQ